MGASDRAGNQHADSTSGLALEWLGTETDGRHFLRFVKHNSVTYQRRIAPHIVLRSCHRATSCGALLWNTAMSAIYNLYPFKLPQWSTLHTLLVRLWLIADIAPLPRERPLYPRKQTFGSRFRISPSPMSAYMGRLLSRRFWLVAHYPFSCSSVLVS